MKASLKAEWLKLVTTRAFAGLALGSALLTAFIAFGMVAQGPPPWPLTDDRLEQVATISATSIGLFCLILGLRAFTEEFRYGTIVHTAFSDPHRTRTTIAKACVAGAGGLLLAAGSVLLVGAVLSAMTAFSGGETQVEARDLAPAAGLVAAGALWAMLGAGVGAVIRQPVPAVVTALLWVLVFENVANLLLGPVARFLPGQTAQALARGAGDGAEGLVAAAVMAAWTAGLGLLAWTTLRARDVI